MTLLLVLLGGAVGAPLRYLADAWVRRRVGSDLPWATLGVNVSGSFALGVLAATAPPWVLALGGVGVCGGLTTFSTFSFETVRLLEEGRVGAAGLNVLLSVGGALAAVAAGYAVAM